jgi:hypothetical protein
MYRNLSSRLILSLLLAAFVLPLATLAQSQDDQSVAEAARRAKELKKAAAKPPKVVTEDDLPASSATASAQPAAATPADGQAPASATDQPGATPTKSKKAKASEDAELAALKAAVEKAKKDADLSKRELALDQDTFYSNPDYAHDTDGKAKLDELLKEVADKKQIFDELKAKLAAILPPGSDTTPAAGPDTKPDSDATPSTPQS